MRQIILNPNINDDKEMLRIIRYNLLFAVKSEFA